MSKKASIVSENDRQRITQAIRAAERRTNGEIFAVVARCSDDYFYVAGFVIVIWTLLIWAALVFAAWFSGLNVSLWVVIAAQLVSVALSLVILRLLPDLRIWLVPKRVAFRRASAEAARQFLAHGMQSTANRTGILIYVSLAEHYAEVVADSGIAGVVDQGQWNGIVTDLVANAGRGDVAEGFLIAIDRAAGLLSLHFPPVQGQENEVDDHLVEL